MDSIKIGLIACPEKHAEYSEILKLFYKKYDVEAAIEPLLEIPEETACDLIMIMGEIKENMLNTADIEAMGIQTIPMVLFGVTAESNLSPILQAYIDRFSLIAAQDSNFMYLSNHFAQIVGDPCSEKAFLNQVDHFIEPPLLEKQMVFIFNTLDLIRQYRKYRDYGLTLSNLQQYFEAAEEERESRNFHLAKLLYEKSMAQCTDNVILLRLSEVNSILGHGAKAFQDMRHALESDPVAIQKAFNSTYLYDSHKFKNAFVKNCPICGEKAIPYTAIWCANAVSFDDRFDPIRLWMYCPHCHHGFAYNVSADLGRLLDGQYTFMEEHVPKTDYNALMHFSGILSALSKMTAGRKVLDVGAGQGECAMAAIQMDFDYTGVEVVPAYANATQNLINHRIYCGDIVNVNIPGSFDIIIAGDIIEHVPDIRGFLKKIRSLLDDKGLLWLSTPDLFAPFHLLNPSTDAMPQEVWHLNYFTRQSLSLLLMEEGFEIVELTISTRYLGSIELICRKK